MCPWCDPCVELKALGTSSRGTLDVILRAVGSHRRCWSTGRTRSRGRVGWRQAEVWQGVSGGGTGTGRRAIRRGERPVDGGSGSSST